MRQCIQQQNLQDIVYTFREKRIPLVTLPKVLICFAQALGKAGNVALNLKRPRNIFSLRIVLYSLQLAPIHGLFTYTLCPDSC